MSNRRI
jgi:putative transposase